MKPPQLEYMTRGDIIGRYSLKCDDCGRVIQDHPDDQQLVPRYQHQAENSPEREKPYSEDK